MLLIESYRLYHRLLNEIHYVELDVTRTTSTISASVHGLSCYRWSGVSRKKVLTKLAAEDVIDVITDSGNTVYMHT